MVVPVFNPDAEPTRAGYSDLSEARALRAEFEGGYSQRSRPGPNPINRSVATQWDVADDVKDYIVGFFHDRAGVDAFQYQMPWDAAPGLWTTESWTCVPIGKRGAATVWRISAAFRREFDII